MVSPYRDLAKVKGPVNITELATKIMQIYQKRLSGKDSVQVRFIVSSDRAPGHDLFAPQYDARLVFRDSILSIASSKNSFEEALVKLAENLDIE